MDMLFDQEELFRYEECYMWIECCVWIVGHNIYMEEWYSIWV